MADTDAWMPLYIGDYLRKTMRLTAEQHGAYLLLIMDYWQNGPAPDNDVVLSQIARLTPDAWSNARSILEQYFDVRDGHWYHNRLEEELAEASRRKGGAKAKAAAAAKARWEKKRAAEKAPADAPSNASSIAPSTPQAMPEQCPSPSPSPVTTNPPSPIGDSPPQTDQQIAQPDPPPPKRETARGCYLPDDWRPNADARQTAHDEGLNDEEIDRCAAKFRDYWCAKSGAGARKRDWLATWRNWVRREVDDGRVGRRAGGGAVGSGAAGGRGGSPDSSAAAAFARAAQRQSPRRAAGGGAG